MSRLDAKQIERIIEVYNNTNSIKKTSIITGHSTNTISNYVSSISRNKTNNVYCKNEILQMDRTGKIINTWYKPSIAARELNINPSSISRALNNKLASAGGYVWKYKE